MTDRERVVIEIESDPNVLNTNCGLTLVSVSLLREVLALLKDQEPRVIYDASEIKLDTVYWMEKKNIVTPWPVAMKMYSQRLPEQLEFEDYYGERWTVSRYLVGQEGWRLWTARPTDEQRREASWYG